MAIVSFICGIVGCLVITSLVGLITGILGLRKAKQNGGAAFAVTGTILSLLWLLGIGIFTTVAVVGVYTAFDNNKTIARPAAIDFVNHLAGGDIDAAAAMTAIPRSQLVPIADYLKPLGPCKDMTVDSAKWHWGTGGQTGNFSGTAVFEKDTKQVDVGVHVNNGQIKIQSIFLKY